MIGCMMDCFNAGCRDLAKTAGKAVSETKNAGVRLIPDRNDITERPAVVESRERVGDWEGDTIHGQNARMVILVDRASQFTLVKRVLSKTKEGVDDALSEMLRKVHSAWTVTLDNGGEFADHVWVERETGTTVYFAKPYARELATRNK